MRAVRANEHWPIKLIHCRDRVQGLVQSVDQELSVHQRFDKAFPKFVTARPVLYNRNALVYDLCMQVSPEP